MTYCTQCGKQNPDTAKFCTGCGTTLKVKPDQSTPVADQRDAEYEKLFGRPHGKKKNTWIIISVIAVLGLGAGAYFIFFNNKKPAEKKVADTVKKDSTIIQPPAVQQTASDPVPLNQERYQEQKMEISQYETDQVTKTIQGFYDAEDKEDVTSLLGYYRFPLDRYYQLYNVGYDKLHKMVVDAYNGKLYYHKIDIKWNYSSVQKLPSGDFKILLFADYTSASQTGEDRKTKSIHLAIILNNNYQITSIYPS
jgi:hypothetical protein